MHLPHWKKNSLHQNNRGLPRVEDDDSFAINPFLSRRHPLYSTTTYLPTTYPPYRIIPTPTYNLIHDKNTITTPNRS